MLSVRNLKAGYNEMTVVDDVSFSVEPGDTVAILGRNGMGKTTLLRSIFGLCDVHEGEILLDGKSVPNGKPEYLARRGMSLMPDDRGVFPSLTIEENLSVARRSNYSPPVNVAELFPLLRDRPGELAGVLSGGEKQQVGIARAILAGERLVAVDELSQGLSPSVVNDVLLALEVVSERGVGVVVVEQTPSIALQLCKRILVMVKGRIVVDESRDVLERTPERLNDLLVVN